MIKRALLGLILLGLVGLGGFAYLVTQPMRLAELPAEFSIPPGSSLRTVAALLAAEGVLTRPGVFVLWARARGEAGQIKAGSYSVAQAISVRDLLGKLTRGDTLLGKLTVIEGWSFRQMRATIAAEPRLRGDSHALSDAELLAAIGAAETHPEGLFFPDTYYFDLGSSDLAVYRRAYQAMQERLAAAWAARVEGLPYQTPYQALIMASIIEKETGVPDERRLIASVFLNRLRIGMRLQTDPTVIYGLGAEFDGNLRRRDLESDTPYNTYVRAGLTPTPIALPGAAALEAALNPETSRYFYFVSRGDGSHQFSANLADHNRAVNRFQRRGGN